jgi:hypothetical protein
MDSEGELFATSAHRQNFRGPCGYSAPQRQQLGGPVPPIDVGADVRPIWWEKER